MAIYSTDADGIQSPMKRKIFVSYHHGGDQLYYEEFSRVFHDSYEVITDNSLERRIDSEDVNYVMRRIREKYISGTSCTIVLVGRDTWGRKYVDWEICATLEKQHSLIGLQLPSLQPDDYGKVRVPDRLRDNIASGYTPWVHWNYIAQNPSNLSSLIGTASSKSNGLINNLAVRRERNA